MDEAEQLSDVDARLRTAFGPDAAATQRVVLAALTVEVRLKPDTTETSTGASVVSGFSRTQRSGRIAGRRFAIAAAAVLLALGAGVGIWRRHAAAPVPATTSLKVTNQGSLLVVEDADGRRWIVGPAAKRRSGSHYVIVVSE